MGRGTDTFSAWSLGALALGTGLAGLTPAASLLSNPVVAAVRHGDCGAAVEHLNLAALSNNDQVSLFVGGRMLDEGICLKEDSVTAAQYFARAADMGDRDAALDHAAKVGLGEGTEQSYERAGDLCRIAGIDREGRLSVYALGYACTVRGVAGKLLRETLPQGAFRPNSGSALVAFNPGSQAMLVRSTPVVGRAEAATGSNMRLPLVDARQVIEKAWTDALSQVPKPDPEKLGNQVIELSLDVDMTLEVGRLDASDGTLTRPIYNGEINKMIHN